MSVKRHFRKLEIKTIMKILLILLTLITIQSLEAIEKYTPIAGENVNVRKDPNLNSQVIIQLPISHLVKVIPNRKVKATVNNTNGYWIYVETGYSSKNKINDGWIFDTYLGTTEKFTRPTQWHFKEFHGNSGDYSLSLKMNKNATYNFSYELCAGANCNQNSFCSNKLDKKIVKNGYILCEGTGIIKVYKDLVWLKHYGLETNEFLFIKNDRLCMSGMLEDGCE
ncbi:SH3 domain-containing protein [Leptospira meyeri]|uniref:SH3 domain-containing protein n=2 Tax=Leptospira meyeri TaxID=29508 RepID=A0A4R8MXN1_LEPME|nr:SH3 domain-containing protein [Leptospira meyeri]